MKKIILLLVLTVFVNVTNAQTPNWGWAETQTGGSCYTQAEQLATGPAGEDIYISGRFAGTMTLNGGLNVTSNGTQVFSAKIDSSGKFIWFSPHTASGGIDYSYGFGIDNKDNTYSTGQIGGSFFIDKFDSNGNQKWYHPGGNAAGYDIKTDDSGNVYITGEFSGSFTIGGITLNSIVGSTDMFLAKLDSNGNGKWAVSGGGTGYDGGRELALDPAGNIYVCGSYSADGIFGTVTAPPVTSGYPSLFITKYNSSGTALRVSTATNAGFDNSYQFWRWEVLTVDSCGNAYVSGNFINTAQFGSLSVTNLANSSSDLHNLYVAKCHFDGNWEWVKLAGGTGDDQTIGIALNRADDIYVTGDIEGTVQFGGGISATATSASGSAFLAKYDNSTGDALWVQSSGGTGNWAFEGIDIDKHGYVYLDGNGGNGTGTFGTRTVTDQASCGQNILIAKMDTIPPRAIIPVLNASYCPGSTDTIPYSLIGSFNSGNVFTVELSDSTGNFISYDTLGSVISNSSGKIGITIPGSVTPGSTYLIRLVSSNPATSSYAACTGDIIDNVYNNSFYVTIGGSGQITASVYPVDTSVCKGAPVSLTATGGTSYSWNNGENGNIIIVNPTTDSVFTVTATGSCGTAVVNDTIKVTPSPALAIQPPALSAIICPGQSIALSVDTSGSNYIWSPSSTLTSSLGDTVIANPTITTVYLVTGISSAGCISFGTDTVTVNSALPLTILPQPGPLFCSGLSAELKVEGGGTNLIWTPTTGLSDTTSGDSVLASPLTTTTYTVTGNDSAGCASSGIEVVTIIASPNKPTFYQHGDTLTSSAATDNQWYMNGVPLSGDTSQNLIINNTSPDSFFVAVNNEANGCSSPSDTVVTTGIDQLLLISNQLSIYPNPFNSDIFINISSSALNVKEWNLQIIDVLGRIVYSRLSLNYNNDIDLSGLSSGVYFITVINKTGRAVVPVVKQN